MAEKPLDPDSNDFPVSQIIYQIIYLSSILTCDV